MTINDKTGWNFDNSYVKLPDFFYTKMNPETVSEPTLVKLNDSLAESLGLDAVTLEKEGAELFSGKRIPEGAEPIAQAYAGHQFGNLTMLGDGRAVLLGEQITPEGDRLDVALKGSGRTPYSRGGDGRAALGPMLREYIISEAMHGLRIPTSRSLAVVTTGDPVYREAVLVGAILTRIASSHLRVGTFQYAAGMQEVEALRELADYAIDRHYPEAKEAEQPYLSFLAAVINRQAALLAKWQSVGFIHGVMNTDNMSISGETIDYGPCAFMDSYDPATVFSSIDVQGRYAYGNQPNMAGWNLSRLAEALLPLFDEDMERAVELAQGEVSRFPELYEGYWLAEMRAKLGMLDKEEGDEALVKGLLDMMKNQGADFTNIFRALTLGELDGMPLFQTKSFADWQKRWHERLERQQGSREESLLLMKQHNPSVIPRNYRVEAALEAAVEQGDYSVMEKLLEVLADPYAYSDKQAEYAEPSSSSVPYQTYCGT